MSGQGTTAGANLRSFIERIERLEEEKANIAADIKQVKAEARGNGFDVKTINAIVKERRLSKEERDEQQALLDLYRAALGMLDGTPLGQAARKRMEPPEPDPDDGEAGEPGAESSEGPDDAAEPERPNSPPGGLTEEDIAAARDRGRQAQADGERVIDNPFMADDPRRAAWDEGWCSGAGSDGMEIPDAWRRRPKKPRGTSESDGGAPAGGEA